MATLKQTSKYYTPNWNFYYYGEVSGNTFNGEKGVEAYDTDIILNYGENNVISCSYDIMTESFVTATNVAPNVTLIFTGYDSENNQLFKETKSVAFTRGQMEGQRQIWEANFIASNYSNINQDLSKVYKISCKVETNSVISGTLRCMFNIAVNAMFYDVVFYNNDTIVNTLQIENGTNIYAYQITNSTNKLTSSTDRPFLGWYTEPECINEFVANTTITSDMSIYAMLEPMYSKIIKEMVTDAIINHELVQKVLPIGDIEIE